MRRIDPLELLYANVLQWVGWNSADVITSERKTEHIQWLRKGMTKQIQETYKRQSINQSKA